MVLCFTEFSSAAETDMKKVKKKEKEVLLHVWSCWQLFFDSETLSLFVRRRCTV